MSVTLESIKALVDRYHAFSSRPNKLDLQLIKGITEGVESHGGKWEYNGEKPVISCFTGLTILCWHFSHTQPVEAAAAYEHFVTTNYNVWAHMAHGAAKSTFQSECHSITDTLDDWKAITKDAHSCQKICLQAINVTSGMYGAGSERETVQAEELWNRRETERE